MDITKGMNANLHNYLKSDSLREASDQPSTSQGIGTRKYALVSNALDEDLDRAAKLHQELLHYDPKRPHITVGKCAEVGRIISTLMKSFRTEGVKRYSDRLGFGLTQAYEYKRVYEAKDDLHALIPLAGVATKSFVFSEAKRILNERDGAVPSADADSVSPTGGPDGFADGAKQPGGVDTGPTQDVECFAEGAKRVDGSNSEPPVPRNFEGVPISHRLRSILAWFAEHQPSSDVGASLSALEEAMPAGYYEFAHKRNAKDRH